MTQAHVEREAPARCTSITGKHLERSLRLPNGILSTCYTLNSSNTKRIIVGFEEISENMAPNDSGFNYEIVIKFVNASCSRSKRRELVMSNTTWIELQEHFDLIETYFTNDYAYYEKYGGQRTVKMGKYELFFNTSYGAKSFVLERHPSAQEMAAFQEISDNRQDVDDDAPTKKRKLYNFPSVVMQNVTFDGVKIVSKCIDAQITRLKAQVENINACATFIKEHLTDLICERVASESARVEILSNIEDFSNFIKEDSIIQTLYQRVKQNLAQEFIDRYFNIVFEEMLAFNLQSMMLKLRKDIFLL